jgi:hypothetical protein
MSHHLDTPLAAKNGQLFIDDLYVFAGDGSTVFIMDVNSNVTGVYAQPGFHPEARYEFKIHFEGAEFEDVTYRASFGQPDADGGQSLRLHLLAGGDAREDGAVGELLLEGRTGETATAGGIRAWAGRAQDSFYIDLSLLSMVDAAVAKGIALDLSEWRPDKAQNSFAGTSVESIVIEVPHADPQLRPGRQIGVWCATKLATDAGGWRQINRGGHPMMWPIFWPDDTSFTNPANSRHPAQDVAADGGNLARRVAALVAASGTAGDPEGYGLTVARQLLPDVLPYEVGTPATFGFAVRNGRTMADNAPEAMLSLVAGTAIPSGLRAPTASGQRSGTFPYVVPAR